MNERPSNEKNLAVVKAPVAQVKNTEVARVFVRLAKKNPLGLIQGGGPKRSIDENFWKKHS